MTPRVGDRVLIPGRPNSVVKTTTCGWVRGKATLFEGDRWYLEPDSGERLSSVDFYAWDEKDFTVLDREPVEWPEGWDKEYHAPDRQTYLVVPLRGTRRYVDPEVFDRIRGPEGDYVAEHWDALMEDE